MYILYNTVRKSLCKLNIRLPMQISLLYALQTKYDNHLPKTNINIINIIIA